MAKKIVKTSEIKDAVRILSLPKKRSRTNRINGKIAKKNINLILTQTK